MALAEFQIFFPIADSVVLEFWDLRKKLAHIPMNIDSEWNWEKCINLDDGLYHYCFFINNSFRINDPQTFPSYVLENGKPISSLVIENSEVRKLNYDLANIEVKHIDMYAGTSRLPRPNREFSNSDGEIGIKVDFIKVKGIHLVSFVWVNPMSEIAYVSECIVSGNPSGKGQAIQASGWITTGPNNQLIPGKWHLVVLVNGNEICCLPFYMRSYFYRLQHGRVIAM